MTEAKYNLGYRTLSNAAGSGSGKQAITEALDANAFDTQEAAADLVNPELWDRRLRAYTEDATPLQEEAEIEDGLLDQAGDTYNVQIDVEPSPASQTDESDAASIQALDYNQVTYNPTEYTVGFQVSDKEARRAFFDVMDNVSKKIGYAFITNREDNAISTAESGASHTVYPGTAAADSDLASGDTMDYETVVDAVRVLKEDNFEANKIFVTPKQFADLSKDQQFSFVDHAGTDETLRTGRVGRIYGCEVFESNRLTVDTSNTPDIHVAIMTGRTNMTGERSFGICRKHLPEVRTEYHALDRKTDIVGAEEWDMQVLREDGLATIRTA